MQKFFLVFLFAFAIGIKSPAVAIQVVQLSDKEVASDSSKLSLRKFEQQKIEAFKQQREFNYETVPVSNSLWNRFWRWFWRLMRRVLENPYSGGFIKYAVILTLAGLLIFAVMKMIGLKLKIFAGKSAVLEVPYTESLDNIHEIDFNEEIEKAINNGNYRLAVRLFYLRSLKKLNDSGLIAWQPEKTNQMYVGEIQDSLKRKQFGLLTTQFEYIWYGEFFIDKENFARVRDNFDQFNQHSS